MCTWASVWYESRDHNPSCQNTNLEKSYIVYAQDQSCAYWRAGTTRKPYYSCIKPCTAMQSNKLQDKIKHFVFHEHQSRVGVRCGGGGVPIQEKEHGVGSRLERVRGRHAPHVVVEAMHHSHDSANPNPPSQKLPSTIVQKPFSYFYDLRVGHRGPVRASRSFNCALTGTSPWVQKEK